jgi:hypothetical protein
MDHVWRKIDELRAEFELLKEDRTPIDVFTFFEVDLGLDAIPFDDLVAKYRLEAAIKVDFSGIYLDAEQLGDLFDEFAGPAEKLVPNFVESGELRDKFSQTVAPRFGVNAPVIAIRLDRDGIWPAA